MPRKCNMFQIYISNILTKTFVSIVVLLKLWPFVSHPPKLVGLQVGVNGDTSEGICLNNTSCDLEANLFFVSVLESTVLEPKTNTARANLY